MMIWKMYEHVSPLKHGYVQYLYVKKIQGRTAPKFHSSPLKNGGWKTILSYLGFGNFSGAKRQTSGGYTFQSFPECFLRQELASKLLRRLLLVQSWEILLE